MSKSINNNSCFNIKVFLFGIPCSQVTEQVRASVESQVLAAREQYKQLEQKLMAVDKEKQSLQEERNKAVAAVEEQVVNSQQC